MRTPRSLGSRLGSAGVGLAALGLAAVAVSQNDQPGAMPSIKPAEHQLAPAFDPSGISMQRWEESMQLGPEHELLGKLVGEWDVVNKVYQMGPEPMVANMRSTIEWVLGGKHLQERLAGEFMGQPFEGLGMYSYDRYNERFVFYWADTMSTGSNFNHGFGTMDGGSIVSYGTIDDPLMDIRGKPVKNVMTLVDDDTYVFEIHDMLISEGPTLVMQLTYTRRD